MKIFAIYSNIVLTSKPSWLDDFRAKYDKPYDYHITLKQPCYVEDDQVQQLKEKVASFMPGPQIVDHSIGVSFDRIIIADQDPNDGCIMIHVADNEKLNKLQTALVQKLEGFINYCRAESAEWEKNFMPHITIGRDLTPQMIEQAKQELHADDLPQGHITELVLAVVQKINPQQAAKPENLTMYKF